MASKYELQKGETPEQYKVRNGVNEPAPTSSPTTGGAGSEAFLAELQKRMLGQADAINSSSTRIEGKINEAIGGLKSATNSERQRIESEYGRNMGYAADNAQTRFGAYAEEQSGFATMMGGFRELVKTTDKEMKDMEQRKQEAILMNDANGASKIAELQLKSLEFQEASKQKVFENLLSMSNFGLTANKYAEDKRQFESTQNFNQKKLDQDQRNKMGEIAAQYGVQMQDGDTLETLVTRAVNDPYISEKKRLELEQMRSQIAKTNTERAKILQGNADEKPFDAETARILAIAYKNGNKDLINGLKTPEQSSAVYGAYLTLQAEEVSSLKEIASGSKDAEDFKARVKASGTSYEQTLIDSFAATIATSEDTGWFSGGDGVSIGSPLDWFQTNVLREPISPAQIERRRFNELNSKPYSSLTTDEQNEWKKLQAKY